MFTTQTLIAHGDPHTSKKRVGGVLSWDEYFMAMAHLNALRSKDPHTRVGACIVGPDNKVRANGYNGFPRGCDDDELPWGRTGPSMCTKYPFVCHAEMNAIMNAGSIQELKGCRLYVVLHPCHECVKLIIQAGIIEVVYAVNKYPSSESTQAATAMLTLARIPVRQLSCNVGFTMNM